MISYFVLENQTTKQKVTLGQDPKYDFVYQDDGLDWGYAPATHSTYFYPGQVGVDISVTNIVGREVTFTGYVHYVPDEYDRTNFNKFAWNALVTRKIKEKKATLNTLVNPNDYIRIIVGDFYLDGKPTRSVQYGADRQSNNELFCLFVINIFCDSPMFHKVEQPKTALTGKFSLWHFPLAIPDTGFKLSTRKDYLFISVTNEGNSSVGGVITLKADGEVLNPTVEIIDTGETFTVYKTLVKNEVVEIDTREGKYRSIKGGMTEPTNNYLQYWDYENTWIQFPVGEVLVGYSTGNDSETLLTVTIDIKPEKFALEEQ